MKNIYDVVKYFKELYRIINTKEEVFIENGNIHFPADPYFLMVASLTEVDSDELHFSKWAQTHSTTINIRDVFNLKAALKKNTKEITQDDDSYLIKYTDKETDSDVDFLCSNKNNKEYSETVKKVISIRKQFNKVFKVEPDFFTDEIFEIYLDGDKLTKEKTLDKILEIPTKKIQSLVKDAESVFIKITDKDEFGRRYVAVGSKNEFAELIQIFITI